MTGNLIAAHEEALRAALEYLEDTAVFVRRGHGGERVQPGEGLIAAAYRHRMSRALDPQLHTHVVAANLTRGPDGRFTALHGAPLYRAAKTAGFLYQSHLRDSVSERLGLEWGPVRKGAAELVGISEGVLGEFSRRRQEMLRAAEQGGISLDTKAAAEKAALATRERKQYGIDTHTWREEVQARAGELGVGRQEVADLVEAGRDRLAVGLRERGPLGELALGDRLAGPQGLTERANTFDERAVLQEFAAAAAQGASVGEVRGQAQRFAQRPDVLVTARGELTTQDLVDCERRLIAAALDRAGERVGLVDSRTVDRVIAAAERPLTAELAAVVRATAASGRGVEVIEALAGSGKTYTAGVLRAVYNAAGQEVLGVAPTGRAARELTDQAGIPSRTLDRLLIDLDQLGDTLPRGAVVVFDEAGMASTRATARLLVAAEGAGAKVIAIGDPGQLASVQAGGWLRAVSRELGALRLTEVMRQRDPAERRALAALHERAPGRYLGWAQDAGRIDTFHNAAGARKQAIAQWAKEVGEVGVEQAVLIAGAPDDRQLALALDHAAHPAQEHAALRAEPTPAPASETRLRDLSEKLEQLSAQRSPLTRARLDQFDDVQARTIRLAAQVGELADRIAELPPARRRRIGHARDPHAAERAQLASAVAACDGELDALRAQRGRLERELGDVDQARDERDSLQHAINSTQREYTKLRDQLTERELQSPNRWVQRTFGERPTRPYARETWERGVRHVARYRVDHHISDPADPLGPEPTRRGKHQRDREHTREMIDHTHRNLGLDRPYARDIGLDIGR